MVVGATMGIKDEKEKLAARAEISSGKLPKYFDALEKILTQNGSTGKKMEYLVSPCQHEITRILRW